MIEKSGAEFLIQNGEFTLTFFPSTIKALSQKSDSGVAPGFKDSTISRAASFSDKSDNRHPISQKTLCF
jgi:hypothetical protein